MISFLTMIFGEVFYETLRWEETEEQYLAIVKPKELFVKGSIFESSRRKYETRWSGKLKEDGEQDLYAFGFIKKWCDLKTAEKHVSWINDGLTWNPEEEPVKEWEQEEPERKAA